MEVLRSSEALEGQILDDARAKASRILQDSDREAAAISEEWRRKADAEAARLDAERDGRIAAVRQELEASLPLDFMRARLSFVQDALSRTLEELFAGLAPAELARIIGAQLRSLPAVFGGAQLVVTAFGIPVADAKGIVESNIPGAVVAEVKQPSGSGHSTGDRGLVIESADRRTRFRGTTGELSRRLLEEHREELAAALLGKDVEEK
jgi:vacuolar-type H+-ATPase subunit E/Vma4